MFAVKGNGHVVISIFVTFLFVSEYGPQFSNW